jgi:polyhydroxyalkanoate synthesis regulator phasin
VQEEKQRLSSLATTVMILVDAMVKKTNSQLDQAARIVEMILASAAEKDGSWKLPLSQERLASMRRVRTYDFLLLKSPRL